MNSERKIDSRQRSVNGSLDNGQIILSFSGGLNTTALAGTVNGNSIALQHVDPQGGVDSLVFARASAAQFKTYADEMKAKAESITVNAVLAKIVQLSGETARSVESWLTDAQGRMQRFPGIKEGYQQIEDSMRALVSRERSTPNPNMRTQISVTVGTKRDRHRG